jgi:hypothetical protein
MESLRTMTTKWKFTMTRTNRFHYIRSLLRSFDRFSCIRHSFITLWVGLLLVMLTLAACGAPGAGKMSQERLVEETRRIAQQFQVDQDLAQAQAALEALEVANPRQWLMLQTELMIAEGADPALTASMVKLTEALNIQSNVIRAYAVQQGLLEPTPTFVIEAVAAAPTPPPTLSTPPSPPVENVDASASSEILVTEEGAPVNEALQLPSPTPPPLAPQARSTGLVNVRNGPGTTFAIVASLAENDLVELIGKTPTGDWWQVRTAGGTTGWVFAQLLEAQGDVSAVAVAANIPEPPTPTPMPAAVAEAPAAEASAPEVPASEAPVEAPAPAGPDFRLVEKRLWDVYENGGSKDGPTVRCGEKRELHVFVRDANGNPLNGVAVQAQLGAREIIVTGAQGKGDGKAEFVLGGGQDVAVVRDVDGREVTSDVAYGLTTDPRAIPFEYLIAGQYCADEAACRAWIDSPFPPCYGHYSWSVTFQRNY